MNTKKKVLFFTKYTADDAVSRNRFYGHEMSLKQQGFEVIYCPFYSAATSKAWYEKGTQPGGLATFFARLRRWLQLFSNKENTVAVIGYPLLPGASFSFYKKWLGKQKRVMFDITNSDVKLEKDFTEVISLADVVITTTPALTRQLLPLAKELVQIPLSVSTTEYKNIKAKPHTAEERKPFRIGWLGTQTTSVRLLLLKDCFLQLHELYNIQIVLIGFDKNKEKELQSLPFVNQVRSEKTDISLLKTCDAGVLPLPDGYNDFPFEMIQYMACGLPVVASSGETVIAINHGNDNMFARSTFEWYSCLAAIIQNQPFYKEMGEKNLLIADDFYSIKKTQKDFLSVVLNINGEQL